MVAPGERLRLLVRVAERAFPSARVVWPDEPRRAAHCPATTLASYNVDDGGSNFAICCAGPVKPLA
jgi:hypothetical protein